MTSAKHRPGGRCRARYWVGLGLGLGALFCAPVQAQGLGVSSQGSTGGLVIPSAEVLPLGTMALTYGNYQEPQFGTNSTRQNMSFGMGLLPRVELFGRFADYNNPIPESILFAGLRDLSPNLKWQLPTPWPRGPKVALGIVDFAGAASPFSGNYLVASDQYGPLAVSLGYARGRVPQGPAIPPTFDGAFGGVELRLGGSGLSVLAEHDGQQTHAGLRWHSPPLAALGRAQLVGSFQRSFDAVTPTGASINTGNFALSLVIPFGNDGARAAEFKPDPVQELPALDAKQDSGALQPTAEERLAALRKALVAVGLERVRVGLREGLWGTSLVVEYENHRYGRNEVDALGLVLGLGAEMAPPGAQRVYAVTFKEGLRLYETSVGIPVYRKFLRGGSAGFVSDSLIWDRLSPDLAAQTRWFDSEPTAVSRVRIEIRPDLNYTLGTEFGAFDYSLAANVQALAPLWPGARLYANYIAPVATSPNMEEGGVFEISRQRRGLRTVAVQQSFWLGKHVLANVAAGRFQYDTLGVQGEAAVFVPNSGDMLRLRGAGYQQAPGGLVGGDRALAVSYRRMLTPTMWLEAGEQLYSDGSWGPSLEWTRWFGDMGVGLFYRRGGEVQFAGLQLSFPLTPRRGMAPGPVIFSGASQFSPSIRTRLTTASEPRNLVQPGAVRDLRLETSLDVEQLNAGRLSQDYFTGQVYRMREVFFAYGRNLD